MNESVLCDCRHLRRLALSAVVITLLSACSDSEEARSEAGAPRGDHVFKAQAEAVDKARDVARQLGEAAASQEEAARKATQ
jgi:hypothetical protein